jgi:hypothetical protein
MVSTPKELNNDGCGGLGRGSVGTAPRKWKEFRVLCLRFADYSPGLHSTRDIWLAYVGFAGLKADLSKASQQFSSPVSSSISPHFDFKFNSQHLVEITRW